MTHSIKSVWIVIFSILAMLMSSYAASSPSMTSMMLSVDTTTSMQHQQHASDQQNSVSSSTQISRSDCHSFVDEASNSLAVNNNSSENLTSCASPDDGLHSCCVSACSTTFYPIQSTQSLSDITYSLALHHPVTIGDKILRPQSFLRPPSA